MEAENTSEAHQIQVNWTDTVSPHAFTDQVSINRVNIMAPITQTAEQLLHLHSPGKLPPKNQAPARRDLYLQEPHANTARLSSYLKLTLTILTPASNSRK